MKFFAGTHKFILFLIFIAVFAAAGYYFDLDPEHSRAFFSRYPPALSGIIFVVLYVVGTFFIWFGPKDVLRVASLFVFGVVWSTVLVYIGEMLNMVTMFWFSRRMGRPFFEKKMQRKWKKTGRAITFTSVPAVFFMKFYPVVPFRFLDLAYGLTGISFLKYAVISLAAAPVRLYVIQYFLDLMISFGLTAVKGDTGLFMRRYMEMTQSLVDNPAVFVPLAVYTFSALIFFMILLVFWNRKKVSYSE